MKSWLVSFDLLLVVSAVLIMGMGLGRRWSRWWRKKPAGASGDWRAVAASVLSHRAILRRPVAGGAHLVVFWGVVLPLGVIILAQFGILFPKGPANALSLVLDITGLALLAGTMFFLLRRLRRSIDGGPDRVLLPQILLLVILISGFLAEGARLRILHTTGFPWPSPVGWAFSLALPASPLFMQLMIRLHFFTVLIFIATIPFTAMHHAMAAPLNVFYRRVGPRAGLRLPVITDGDLCAGSVDDLTWKQLLDIDACVACGRCEEACPAALSGKSLSPRVIIRKMHRLIAVANGMRSRRETAPLRLEDAVSSEEIWDCTSCMACVAHCPVCIEPLDVLIDMRRYRVMGEAQLPDEARPMIRDLERYGDVQGKGPAHRMDWALNQGVPRISRAPARDDSPADVLLWVGCSGAFHPRNQETSRAMVKILKAAGVPFSILGHEEMCCGDPARRLGDEALFRKLARANIDRLNHYPVEKIVTLCPHCLNTLKNEYPMLGCAKEVIHATELIAELIRTNRITPRYPVAEKMTLHDACYLGRYNQIYAPPRDICRAVPGCAFTETARHGENGFCCGGGGGRMWLHENTGRNINRLRAEEMAASDVELIGTACPYCLVMLDDGVKSLDLKHPPRVADIVDIVAETLG